MLRNYRSTNTVRAVQFTGTKESVAEITELIENDRNSDRFSGKKPDAGPIKAYFSLDETGEVDEMVYAQRYRAMQYIKRNDWAVLDADGDLYVYSNETFAQLYGPA